MGKVRKGLHRALSALLALLMVFSAVPASAAAAETETYQKISSADEFTSGKYVMMVDSGYAVGPLDGTWVTAVALAAADDSIVNPGSAAVTLTVDG